MRTNVTSPIVISLGKTRESHVRELRTGGGPIIDDVREVMRLVSESVNSDPENTILLPIVVVYVDAQEDDPGTRFVDAGSFTSIE